MKRLFIILIVASIFGGVAFARGAADGQGNFGRSNGIYGQGVNRAQGFASEVSESVTTSGSVRMIDDQYVLETSDGTYSISAPGFPRSGAPMPVGEMVEVSGLLLPTAAEDCPVDADGHIVVESALYGGEEFVFTAGPAGGGNRNSRGMGQGSRYSRDGSDRQYAGNAKGTYRRNP